ncbi:MAG: hypothetical protein IT564_11420 [Rhodospirillales bacterium]|nr:hypothetical protein [Rhodospirillales bacterium]
MNWLDDNKESFAMALIVIVMVSCIVGAFLQPRTVMYRAEATVVDRHQRENCNSDGKTMTCTTIYTIVAVEDTEPIEFDVSRSEYYQISVGDRIQFHVSKGDWIPLNNTSIDGLTKVKQ